MFIPERPRLGPELLDEVASAYGITWTGEPTDLGGSSSLNVGLERFVIRVHRRWLPVSRLEAMQTVRLALRAAGLPFIAPMATRAGARWMRWQSHLVEVEDRVEGEDMNSWDRLLHGMELLGRVHDGFANLRVPQAARAAPANNQITVAEAQACAQAARSAVAQWPDVTAEEIGAAQMTEQHARTLGAEWRHYNGRLRRQLVHGDFWDNNVLFEEDRVVAVLDLDFMAERDRIDDVALILYYANSGSTLPHDLPVEQRRVRLRELVDAYDRAASPPLDAIERQALPLALARMMLKYTRHLIQRAEASRQREVLAAELPELNWSAEILDELQSWQAAFA